MSKNRLVARGVLFFLFTVILFYPQRAISVEDSKIIQENNHINNSIIENEIQIGRESFREEIKVSPLIIKTTSQSIVEKRIPVDLLTVGYLTSDNLDAILESYSFSRKDYEKHQKYTDKDIKNLSRTIYGEARSNKITIEEKAAVVWCVLNRIDNQNFKNSFKGVLTKSQFHGLSAKNYTQFYYLAEDVCIRWTLESMGIKEVGRVLPKQYLYFSGYKGHNHFRKKYKDKNKWDWSLPTPYQF